MKEILIIITCSFLTVCGQICLKTGLAKNGGFWLPHVSPLQNIVKWLTSPIMLAGLLIYLSATILFMYLLNHFDLTYFYPWTAITYVFAFLAGTIIFKEHASPQKILGTVIIIIGVIVISKGS
jgi:multidrug transporter EmrE-like cation transporter